MFVKSYFLLLTVFTFQWRILMTFISITPIPSISIFSSSRTPLIPLPSIPIICLDRTPRIITACQRARHVLFVIMCEWEDTWVSRSGFATPRRRTWDFHERWILKFSLFLTFFCESCRDPTANEKANNKKPIFPHCSNWIGPWLLGSKQWWQ